MSSTPNIYKLDQTAFSDVRRRLIINSVITFVLVICVAAFFIGQKEQTSSLGAMYATSIFLFFVIIFSIKTAVKRERKNWESFTLIVTENDLTRKIASYPDITLTRYDIVSIKEVANGTLTVSGPSLNQTIFIHPALEGRDALLEMLATWRPIEKIPLKWWQRYMNSIVIVCMLGLLGFVFVSTNPLMVVPAAVILMTVLCWSAYMIIHGKHYDQRLKRSVWLFIFPIIGIAGRAIILIFQ